MHCFYFFKGNYFLTRIYFHYNNLNKFHVRHCWDIDNDHGLIKRNSTKSPLTAISCLFLNLIFKWNNWLALYHLQVKKRPFSFRVCVSYVFRCLSLDRYLHWMVGLGVAKLRCVWNVKSFLTFQSRLGILGIRSCRPSGEMLFLWLNAT